MQVMSHVIVSSRALSHVLAARVQVSKIQDLLRLVRQAFKALQAPGAEPKAPPGGGPDAETVGGAADIAAATVASFEVRVNELGDNVLQ